MLEFDTALRPPSTGDRRDAPTGRTPPIHEDPGRHLVVSQCSGALVMMIRLGPVEDRPVCTDRTTHASVEAVGRQVLDEPSHARGRVATAGGSPASHSAATWPILAAAGRQAAAGHVAPFVDRALSDGRAVGGGAPRSRRCAHTLTTTP